jgi:hypothetical protein
VCVIRKIKTRYFLIQLSATVCKSSSLTLKLHLGDKGGCFGISRLRAACKYPLTSTLMIDAAANTAETLITLKTNDSESYIKE